jgi:hypothetical protein
MSVTLLAFGRRGYAHGAACMVTTLRHQGYRGRIHLHVGAALRPHIPLDALAECEVHTLAAGYTQDPGWCKVNLPRIIQEPTLYLDVDGIAVRDVTPLIAGLSADGRHYITCVMGSGRDGERIEYHEWATTAKVREMHDLPPDAVYYGIQSSWAWMVPGDALDAMHATMVDAWGRWTINDLRYKWGATKPDELFYSIACTVMGHDPAWEDRVAFFGRGFLTVAQIKEAYYIMSLYGGKGVVPARYVQVMEHLVRGAYRAKGVHAPVSIEGIRKDKYVNTQTT